jgi:hypothetical protein
VITDEEKANCANRGQAIAKSDPMVAAFRNLQRNGARQVGFDIGLGATEG